MCPVKDDRLLIGARLLQLKAQILSKEIMPAASDTAQCSSTNASEALTPFCGLWTRIWIGQEGPVKAAFNL